MVFYFTCANKKFIIYMGKDKYENDDLIKYGFPEDVWFHVDGLSSAHVYIRMPKGMTWEELPEDVIEDCCQLCKANSIQGSKQNNVVIQYTPWANLVKTKGMEAGAVLFRDEKLVKRFTVDKKKNEIINRLNKTKVEKQVDLAAAKETRSREQSLKEKKEKKEAQIRDREQREKNIQDKALRNYSSLMKEEDMTDNSSFNESDFM
eukprot:TRINITY_DN14712_c0_g1_i1.p1 TRINITY_DN14712_c0_g1~~TRINITY_DN14712_c0_g1_i1.p1  ORF type:complete len:205 (-),score=59.39 TRINITY_DN14712_c0_g1_i1:96-710(-)